MSKAFTKETDNEDDEPEKPDTLFDNVKNYVTPLGYAQLHTELNALVRDERPKLVETVRWAAGNGDRSENGDYIYGKRRLREIDRRVRYLMKRLENAEIIDPTRQQHLTKIFFGATVTFKNSEGIQQTVKLVGVDEADLEKNKISWISPVARALLKAEVDDIVQFKTPTGSDTLTVIAIRYESDL